MSSLRAASCLLSSRSLCQPVKFGLTNGIIGLHRTRHISSVTNSLPRVAQPSLWHSMVPKFLRPSERPSKPTQPIQSKDWNPATFYIVIFLLIGSNAINMIALRNDFVNFSRKAERHISQLKEVIERVQRGEDVDIEAMLGTGDASREEEWNEVLKEIETEDQLMEIYKKRQAQKEEKRMKKMEAKDFEMTPKKGKKQYRRREEEAEAALRQNNDNKKESSAQSAEVKSTGAGRRNVDFY